MGTLTYPQDLSLSTDSINEGGPKKGGNRGRSRVSSFGVNLGVLRWWSGGWESGCATGFLTLIPQPQIWKCATHFQGLSFFEGLFLNSSMDLVSSTSKRVFWLSRDPSAIDLGGHLGKQIPLARTQLVGMETHGVQMLF